MSTWIDDVEHELTTQNLGLLLDNKIPAIRVRNFATADECAAFSAAAKQGNMQYYNVADRIGYIGLAQYQYRWTKTKAEFLADVPKAQADVEAVFAAFLRPAAASDRSPACRLARQRGRGKRRRQALLRGHHPLHQ